MPVHYGSIIDEHRAVRQRGRPVRPLAHGRAAGQRHRRRGGAGRTRWSATRGAWRSAAPATRLLCAARRRHHRRPHRLPPRRRRLPGRAQRVQPRGRGRRAAERAWPAATPSSSTRRSRPRWWRSRGRRRPAILGRLTDCASGPICATTRAAEARVAGDPALRGAHRLHRRGRLRAVRAPGTTRRRCGRRSLEAGAGAGPAAVRPRRARHAAPGGGHAALRQRARPRARRPSRPASAGPSSSTSDFVGRDALAPSRDGPGTQLVGPRPARVVASPGTATPWRAPARPSRSAWSPAAASRPRWARPSPWPTFRPIDAGRGYHARRRRPRGCRARRGRAAAVLPAPGPLSPARRPAGGAIGPSLIAGGP